MEHILDLTHQQFRSISDTVDKNKTSWRQASYDQHVDAILKLVHALDFWKAQLFAAMPWIQFTIQHSPQQQQQQHAIAADAADAAQDNAALIRHDHIQ